MLKAQIIGNKITEARKKVNISQAQLANQLFISPQAVGKWERGESLPDIITLNRLAELLGVDLNYFSENFKPLNNAADKTLLKSQNARETLSKTPNWDMSKAIWADADFSGLTNLDEKFNSSIIQRCKFSSSNLSGLMLKDNVISLCDFSNSNVSQSQIQQSMLSENNFSACSLKEATFVKTFVESCDFTGADFTGTSFENGGFGKNDVSKVTWQNSVFKNMYLDRIEFEGNINDCIFENCTFKNVVFLNCHFKNTFFKNNKGMKNVKFENCTTDKITFSFLKNAYTHIKGIEVQS